MEVLYFSHSYHQRDRKYNQHAWMLLKKHNFQLWIDSGKESGLKGKSIPMEISFNEWMLSRCNGFVAVMPKRNSPYLALEYRIALRMGIPTLIFMEEGGDLGRIKTQAITYPTEWNTFWEDDFQERIEREVELFAQSVKLHTKAKQNLSNMGNWLPRAEGRNFTLQFLKPSNKSQSWEKIQQYLLNERKINIESISPLNLNFPHDLVQETTKNTDLLVVDVGPYGTPKEQLGYVEGLGIPQVRVCNFKNMAEREKLSTYLDPKNTPKRRSPFEQLNEEGVLPSFLDGMKLDKKMEPVYFWRNWKQLAKRISRLLDRIDRFRSGNSLDEGGSKVVLSTEESARAYFKHRFEEEVRANVFISYSGSSESSAVVEKLAPIIRFLDCDCFNYKDSVSTDIVSRLESGESVEKGLEKRINDASLVIILADEKYLQSKYCKQELKISAKLMKQNKLQVRPYSISSKVDFRKQLGDLNPYRFGSWKDDDVIQIIIRDLINYFD